MERTYSVNTNRFSMFFGSISFMCFKDIFGKFLRNFLHKSISLYLSNDTRHSDEWILTVALNDSNDLSF